MKMQGLTNFKFK